MITRSFVLLVLLLAPSLPAQVKNIVGELAPEFSADATVNETEYRKLADCMGDVTVVRIF